MALGRLGLIVASVLALSAWGLFSCSYNSQVISGKVVDDVGTPIAGAVVVAMWELLKYEGFNPLHEGAIYRHGGFLKITEVLTDERGAFTVPAWGPLDAEGLKVASSAPRLLVYKRGFRSINLGNELDPRGTERTKRPGNLTSDWNGKSITLPKEDDPAKDAFIGISARNLWEPEPTGELCYWEQAPKLIAELVNLRADIKPKALVDLPELPQLYRGGGCNDPRELVTHGLRPEIVSEYDPHRFEPLFQWKKTGPGQFSLEFLGSGRTGFLILQLNAPEGGRVTVWGRPGSAPPGHVSIWNNRAKQGEHPKVGADRGFSTTIDVLKGDRLLLQAGSTA